MKTLRLLAAVAIAAAIFASSAGAAEKSREQWKTEYVRPADVPFPEYNPYTLDKVRLGKTLFFDPRLSGSDLISCATCHNPSLSWSDGMARGFGHGKKRQARRTPTLWNLAWADTLMWDGRFESLEEQVLGPMGNSAEMNQNLDTFEDELRAIDGYRALFDVAWRNLNDRCRGDSKGQVELKGKGRLELIQCNELV